FAGAALGVLVGLARQLTRSVPDNGFGLCSGGGSGSGERPALTPWLSGLLNGMAGLPAETPLTFRHLWIGAGGDLNADPPDAEDRRLQLAMMTTNLVNRRAHQLPWDNREWYFDVDEFRALFAPEVVDWMARHAPPLDPDEEKAAEERAWRERALP